MANIELEKLTHEIMAKMSRDNEPKVKTRAFADEVAAYAKDVAWPTATGSVHSPPNHPWSHGGPGSYEEAFGVRQNRTPAGRFTFGFTVYNNHPNANFIEFGTNIDKPGSRSPWGPNTPTPEYGVFARTAHHFGGTAP